MRVKAKALGFHDNKRRRPGTIFEIKSEKEFSQKWMEKVDDVAVVAQKKKIQKQEVVEDVSSDDTVI